LVKKEIIQVWLIKISMPRHLLNDILSGSVDVGDKKLDFTELDHAYDADLDKAAIKDTGEEEQAMAAPAAMAPAALPPGM